MQPRGYLHQVIPPQKCLPTPTPSPLDQSDRSRLPKKWCAWPNAGDLSAPAEGPQMSIKVGRMKTDLYIVGWMPSLKPNISPENLRGRSVCEYCVFFPR